MANNSSLSKRAALRQQQEMDERSKRNKRVLFAGIGVVAVVVIVVLAIVIGQAIMKGRGITEDQVTPPNATSGYGILLGGKQPEKSKPHLVIWEDYQCPYCGQFEQTYGPVVEQLVDEGKLTAEIRTAYFLDGAANFGPSRMAAIAAAAADDVGKYREYHDVVYANQPREGVGYPNPQLRDDFAKQAGIEGDDLATFQKMFDERATADFTKAAGDKFNSEQIGSTPTYLVSGVKLQFSDESNNVLIMPTPESFLEAATKAWEEGGKKIEA